MKIAFRQRNSSKFSWIRVDLDNIPEERLRHPTMMHEGGGKFIEFRPMLEILSGYDREDGRSQEG